MTLLSTLLPAAAEAVARWSDPETRPLFKGSLIDWGAYQSGGGDGDSFVGGCACAQGDILLHNGFGPRDLARMQQTEADSKVAELLGISVAHAILLRNVNDQGDGNPQAVLTNPQSILGDQAHIVLAFWRHLDRMTDEQWDAVGDAAWGAAWDAVGAAAWAAARVAAWAAAWAAARVAAWAAVGAAAGHACAEIQGARILREQGKPFFFLPMFGFADPEAVLAADQAVK